MIGKIGNVIENNWVHTAICYPLCYEGDKIIVYPKSQPWDMKLITFDSGIFTFINLN